MGRENDMARLMLPGRLDPGAAQPLLESLLALRGSPLVINATEVDHATTLCMQVLLASAAAWKADGFAFRIADASAQFVEAAGLLGLSHQQLPMEPKTP